MKSKRRWLLLIFPLALFIWAYQAASWRPKLIGVQPTFAGNELKPIPPGLLQGTGASAGFRLLVSPDAKLLASSGSDNQSNFVMLWDTVSRQRKWQIKRDFNAWLNPLAFSPDSRTLSLSESFINSNEFLDKIILLDVSTGKRRRDISYGFAGTLQSAAFLSNRQLVISTSRGAIVVDIQTGKAIRQWKFEIPELRASETYHSPRSTVSADGTTVTVVNANYPADGDNSANTIGLVYDARTGQLHHKWITNNSYARNLVLSPDGKLWAIHNSENCCLIGVYDNITGQQAWRRNIETGASNQSWAWSADSKSIFSILSSPSWGTLVTNKDNGREPIRLPGPSDTQALALAPDGDYFYTLDNTGKIWRWRAR